MKKAPLTIVILQKNQSHLVRAQIPVLQQYAEEILIIDDFSLQDTASLQGIPRVRVIQHALKNDFAAQRNFALTQVQSDWTLFLDADETASPEFLEELTTHIHKQTAEAFWMVRQDVFLGKKLQGGEAAHTKLLRCARTLAGKGKWRRAVHEVWEVPSVKTFLLSSPVLHTPHATLGTFLAKLHFYAAYEPLARSQPGRIRWFFELFTYPFAKFWWNFIFLRGYKDGGVGIVHALCMSYYSLITRIFVYEKYFLKPQHE